MATVENTYALTSFEVVIRFLEQQPVGKDETVVVDLINQVTGRMESYCGRLFRSRTYTHDGTTLPRLDSYGGRKLWLDNPPVTSVTGLKVYPTNSALTEGYASGFVVHRDEGIIELVGGLEFYALPQVVELTYIGGYQDGPAAQPGYYIGYATAAAEVGLACAQQVAHEYKRRTRERDGLVSVSGGGATFTYRQDAWLPEVREVLDRYARRMPSWR